MFFCKSVGVFHRNATFFSTYSIPTPFKIGISFFLAYLLFYTVDAPTLTIDLTYLLLVFKEVLIGLLIGLMAYIILSAVQIAGGFIDFQMGFAIANVIDPQTGTQSPIIGQYLYIFALLLLLSVNGHHILIDGMYNSYQIIPIEQATLNGR